MEINYKLPDLSEVYLCDLKDYYETNVLIWFNGSSETRLPFHKRRLSTKTIYVALGAENAHTKPKKLTSLPINFNTHRV